MTTQMARPLLNKALQNQVPSASNILYQLDHKCLAWRENCLQTESVNGSVRLRLSKLMTT